MLRFTISYVRYGLNTLATVGFLRGYNLPTVGNIRYALSALSTVAFGLSVN